MKKILFILIIAFLFVGALSLNSCKKCTTCSYNYQIIGEPVATYTYPEICGSNEDIDDYKTVCANAAAVYGNSCTCVDD